MKKYLVLIVMMIFLLTGCDKNDILKEAKNINDNYQKQENIIKDTQETNNEDDLVKYLNDVEDEVDKLTTKKESITIKNKLKNTFITLTDFAFYGGTIKGMTFNELSDTAKTKVLNIIDSIDTKINNKYPNYKETIKEKSKKTYSNVKEKLKETKKSIIENYKNKVSEETYNNTVEAYTSDVESIKEAYAPYKPVVDEAKEQTKEAYKKAKEKASEWYNNYKEVN
ncbi:MAG: hypothetical protein E7160_00270 [Firmicutes bacterium]|nr:hypothetical protein [Bacillota bacterium]